jgi:peptidoglycan/xylan/chitin deacetylase (PgdA/CDA1 family)
MRERIRLFLAACFYYSGLVRLALWRMQRSGPRLIILNYHRATGKKLYQQLCYLHRHYRVMHLEDALEELYATQKSGCKRKGDARIPLVLTFDDGYLDNYIYAFPFACRLKIPITIFLIPGYTEHGQYFWWLADDYLVRHTKVEQATLDKRVYHLAQVTDRAALARDIDGHTRAARSVAEREAFLSNVQKILEVVLPCRGGLGKDDLSLPLNWEEIGVMERSGWVSFGVHTLHHPVLSYLVDPSEVSYEVKGSRWILEQQLGHPIRTFAYPIGKPEHIGAEGLRAAKEAGYQWAVTTIEQINTPETDPYMLGRLPGDVTQHWLIMASELVSLLGFISRLRKKYAKIAR